MGGFEIAAVLLFLGGAAGVGWVLLPLLRSQRLEVDADLLDEPDLSADLDDRLLRVLERGIEEADGPEPWERRLPLAEGSRITAPFRPSDALLVALTEEQAFLLPLDLLEASEPGLDVQRGRTLGRPVHAVRLRGETYLDLVTAARFLPIIAAELDGLGLGPELQLFDDLAAVVATERIPVIVAPWLMESGHAPTAPEGEGIQRWTFTLEGRELVVEAFVPAVRRGAEAEDPVLAARVRLGEAEEAGGLEPDAREALGGDDTTWQWTREELLELAAVGNRLEDEGLDLDLVEAAFADRTLPDPGEDAETALMVAAVLNWAGVVVRRHDLPQRAIGYFDAGLAVVADPDNRADLHYNRGAARLHAASDGREPTDHEQLHTFTFGEVEAALLEGALRDFTMSTGLNPVDPDAWTQIAVVQQLKGNAAAASEAWLQAATRTHDEAVRQRMLANAEAMRRSG